MCQNNRRASRQQYRNERRQLRYQHRDAYYQPFSSPQTIIYERRQGPIGLLIGLLVSKAQEKKQTNSRGINEKPQDFSYGEQATGQVRRDLTADNWVDDRREGEYQADGRSRMDDERVAPPSYQQVVKN